MKKSLLLCLAFLGISFVFSGLQSSLYFSPIALPSIWFIVFTYYSFRKSIQFSLIMNIPLALVIMAFSLLPISRLLILMNLMTLFFYFTRERFHTSNWHIALASGGGFMFFLSMDWIMDSLFYSFRYPNALSWLGMGISTLVFAIPMVFILQKTDQKIEYERIDTLENLRI